jgi:hypothetical protein
MSGFRPLPPQSALTGQTAVIGKPFVTASLTGYEQTGFDNARCDFGPDSPGPGPDGYSVTYGQAEADAYLNAHGTGICLLMNGATKLIVPSTGNYFLTPSQLGAAATSPPWNTVQAPPFYTVSAVGTAQGYPKNNYAQYGPDSGDTTNGINSALASGYSVLILPGDFTISDPIVPTTSGQKVVGSGLDYTYIGLADGANCDMIDIPVTVEETLVSSLTLDGTRTHQSGGTAAINVGGTGAGVGNCWRTHLQELKILNAYGDGVWANNPEGASNTEELLLDHLDIENVGGSGIVDNTGDSDFNEVNIGSPMLHGWYHTGTDVHARDVHAYNTGGNGFQIEGGNTAHLVDCIADTTANHGFIMDAATAVLTNCVAYNCGYAAANSYNAYVFGASSQNNTMRDCIETDSTGKTWYAVKEAVGGDYNQVIGGKMQNYTAAKAVALTGLHSFSSQVGGWNPQGFSAPQPAVPASASTQFNSFGFKTRVSLTGLGGGVSAVQITDPYGGSRTYTNTWYIGAWWELEVAYGIALTYAGSPTWAWEGL